MSDVTFEGEASFLSTPFVSNDTTLRVQTRSRISLSFSLFLPFARDIVNILTANRCNWAWLCFAIYNALEHTLYVYTRYVMYYRCSKSPVLCIPFAMLYFFFCGSGACITYTLHAD